MFRAWIPSIFIVTTVVATSLSAQDSAVYESKGQGCSMPQQDVEPTEPEELPKVLIIGDSISMGYTPGVKSILKERAIVARVNGNCEGTTKGVAQIEAWLGDNDWDLIHFNFGLHDIKRVKAVGTNKNSNDPNDPYQADLETYAQNLQQIVEALKQSDAKLMFATTTPFPSGVNPFRDPKDVESYNDAAIAIMKENDIQINDLCSSISERLAEFQQPINVHFTQEGSLFLAQQVADALLEVLEPEEDE